MFLMTNFGRVVYTECPVTCPCGERCSNQRIQRRDWLSRSLEKFLTDDRGFGVRTTQAITAGTTRYVSLHVLLRCFIRAHQPDECTA